MRVHQGLCPYHLIENESPVTSNITRLFTGNSYISRAGKLVMGRGAAKEVRDRYPGVDYILGSLIPHLSTYGLRFTRTQRRDRLKNNGGWQITSLPFDLGVFQVKHNFSDEADLGLIFYSGRMLAEFATEHRTREFWMNYPGIGNGRLSRTQVDQVLTDCLLPDNVVLFIA